jgi:hypothetical protein
VYVLSAFKGFVVLPGVSLRVSSLRNYNGVKRDLKDEVEYYRSQLPENATAALDEMSLESYPITH